jgi:hypothetical protein
MPVTINPNEINKRQEGSNSWNGREFNIWKDKTADGKNFKIDMRKFTAVSKLTYSYNVWV